MSQQRKTISSLLSIMHDECVRWPHGENKDGYGLANFYRGYSKKGMTAARAVLLIRDGLCVFDDTTKKGMHAGHTCGNRWCVNPTHLRWRTPEQNAQDKLLQGKHNTAMSDGDVVRLMVDIVRGTMKKDIVAKYGTSYAAIDDIAKGKTYKHLPRPYGLYK